MPFKRKTLTELRAQNQQFLRSELNDPGALLRFSNLRILADMDAGMAHLHYGYLDYIAKQVTPFTATDEWLDAWAALKRKYRKPPTAASCEKVRFTGMADSVVPQATRLNRGDGYQYQVTHEGKIDKTGQVIVPVMAILPDISDAPEGGGKAGNSPKETKLTLDIPLAGVDAEAITLEPMSGGADIEDEEIFRQRMLLAFQNPPQGGSDMDYVGWANEVAGVTRAWVKRRLVGAGTVGVYIMCDNNENKGFPSGKDGVASKETYAVHASGDQLRVADHLYDLQTVTALVWVCSPIAKKIDFAFAGIKNIAAETQQQIEKAIDNVFFDKGDPCGEAKIHLSDLQFAIADIPGTGGFVLKKPQNNLAFNVGELPVRGEITYL